MQTVYDWATIAIFAALIVIFLQRSIGASDPEQGDSVWSYLPPSVALAVANYLGNGGYGLAAWLIIAGTIAYIMLVIKPVPLNR